MEYAKKMILMDPKLMSTTPPIPLPATSQSILEIDNEMRRILDRKDLDEHDKAQQYYQALKRYLTRFDQIKSEWNSLTKPVEKEAEQQKDRQQQETIERDVLESVPKTLKPKAERLLNRIKRHSDLTWNERGEIISKGQTIPHSNLTDLVNDTLRKRRYSQKPQGWSAFATAMRDANVPQDLVGNPEWRGYLSSPKTTPMAMTAPRHSTPAEATSSRKANKTKRKQLMWDSYENEHDS